MNRIFFICFFIVSCLFAVDFVIPEVQNKFDSVDSNISTINTALTQTADGNLAKRVARATWDFAEHGGDIGAIDLGVNLPAKSLINFAYFYVVTQVTDGGSGTGALHCEDANNLYSAADVTGNASGTIVLGVPQNSAATMVKDIAAECALTWTIAGSAATAGKLNFFVEYTVVD